MSATAIAHADERRSRWIPWAFVAFFGVVLAANAAMIVDRVPDLARARDGRRLPARPRLRRTLEAAAAQAALGWKVEFAFEQTGRAHRALTRSTSPTGSATLLEDAEVQAALRAPDPWRLRPARSSVPHHYGGRYLADVELPLAGQWEMRVRIDRAGPRLPAARADLSAAMTTRGRRPGWPGRRRQTPRRSTPRRLCAAAPETGGSTLHLMVEGVHCGGCVRRIERALLADPAVEQRAST